MEAETPEAVGSGICVVGFLGVFFIISFHGGNDADANLFDKVVGGVQRLAMGFPQFGK